MLGDQTLQELHRENPIVFLASAIDGCALWRLFFPYQNFPGSSFFCFRNHIDFSKIIGNEIVVVQRLCTQKQFETLHVLVKTGMKVIYDADDDLWELPPYNPVAEILKKYREGAELCMRMCDVITVSTRYLKRVFEHRVKVPVNVNTGRQIPIVVAENRIWGRGFVQPEKPERLTIGWAGSSSHIGDIELVFPALEAIGREHPEVAIEMRGCALPPNCSLEALPNFHHMPWTPVPEYGARMPVWRWSIALAPITDHSFNFSKSAAKAIEAGYCGIPCLMSWLRPYEEFVHHDKELEWLLCASPSSWERKLRELVNDDVRREELGRRMRKVVDDHYSWNRPHEGWLEAFRLARGGTVGKVLDARAFA